MIGFLLLFWMGGPVRGMLPDSGGADTLRLRLPEVTVVATRTPIEPHTAPGRLERIRPAETVSPLGSVAELLRDQTNLSMRAYGPGAMATLSWRGTDGAHTLVLLDGLPLGNAQNAVVDLELLPAALWDVVELAYGSGSALYGSSALGGVLRLVPPDPPMAPWSARFWGQANDYGLREGGLGLASRSGAFWVQVIGYGAWSANRYRYQDNTVYPPVWRRRQNADYEQIGGWIRSGYERGPWRFRLSYWGHRADRGLPGPIIAGVGRARQEDVLSYGWAELAYRPAGLEQRLLVALQRDALRYSDPDADLLAHHRNRSWAFWYEGTALPSPEAHLAWGLWYRHQSVESANLARFRGRHLLSLYGSALWRLRPGWLVYPALRADFYSDASDAISPRLGMNLVIRDGVAFKAQVGRNYRVPTFNDLYWIGGGNPELKPERSWAVDGGLRYQAPRGEGELTLFWNDIRQRIVWLPGPDGRWRAQNQGHVRIRGLEASLRGQVSSGLELGVLYTGLDARKQDRSGPGDRTHGRVLMYVPPHMARLTARIMRGSWLIEARALLSSYRYTTADNTAWLPGYGLLTLAGAYSGFWQGIRIRARVALENLFDTPYQIMPYYPMPGRALRVGVEFSWPVETRTPRQ
jgi:vitamin B12 transporter